MSNESIFRFNKGAFEAPTIENDLGRLNADQIADQIKFTNRANAAYNYVKNYGYPPGYRESCEKYNEIRKNLDRDNSSGAINLEALYALDTAIGETIWDADVFSKMGIPTTVMTNPRWMIKDYLTQSEEWPKFSKEFRNPTFIRIKESSQFSNGIGMHLGISIPFTKIRESGGALWSPESVMMQELSAKFGLMKSRRGFLGTSCANAYGSDGSDAADYGITGLFNYASAQTFEGGPDAVGDDDVTAAGDIEATVRIGLTDLKKVYQPGKYYIVSTSGVASEMYLHRQTYQDTFDTKRVKELLSVITDFAKNGQWGGWWVTEQLDADAVTTGTGQMMIFKAGPSLINRQIVYPTQMLPMNNKDYEQDIQENMIFGDLIQVKKVDTTNNAVPITIAEDLTTTTTGFIPDGVRIM